MPASKQFAVLSVRLPQSELRRVKSLAASRGLSLQQAVQEALRAWPSPVPAMDLPALDVLEGSLAGIAVEKLMRQERRAELAKDRRRS